MSWLEGAEPFPAGFVWGAATSAYQVEGAVAEDGRGPSIWDTLCVVPGAVRNGETGAAATDHYHRLREDVALMADIGLQAYRFSTAWPRIQRDVAGPPIEAGLDFYRRLVDALLEAGIRPMIALYHWDLPQVLQGHGGWPVRDSALRFADSTEIVFRALHDRVQWWGTIDEPWCVAFPTYLAGTAAPGEREARRAIRAVHHVLLAHGLATAAMRALDARAQLGIFLNLHPPRPVNPHLTARLADGVRRIDTIQNRLFLDPVLKGAYPDDATADLQPFGVLPVADGDLARIAAPLDWLGVNYYFDRIVELGDDASALGGIYPGIAGIRQVPAGPGATDMGWPTTPAGLHGLLVRLTADYPGLPPLLVTENGAAFDDPPDAAGRVDDLRRISYLASHIGAVRQAIADRATCAGTSSGRSSTTSNGPKGIRSGSGWFRRLHDLAEDAATERELVPGRHRTQRPWPRRPGGLGVDAPRPDRQVQATRSGRGTVRSLGARSRDRDRHFIRGMPPPMPTVRAAPMAMIGGMSSRVACSA